MFFGFKNLKKIGVQPLAGWTLMELVISLSIIGAIVLFTAVLINRFTLEQVYRRHVSARDELHQRVRTLGHDLQALRASVHPATGDAAQNTVTSPSPMAFRCFYANLPGWNLKLPRVLNTSPSACRPDVPQAFSGIAWPWGFASGAPANEDPNYRLGYPLSLYVSRPNGVGDRLGGGIALPSGVGIPTIGYSAFPLIQYRGQAYTALGAPCTIPSASLSNSADLLARCPMIVQTGLVANCGYSVGSGGVVSLLAGCNRPESYEIRYRIAFYDGRDSTGAPNPTRQQYVRREFGGRIPQTILGASTYNVDRFTPVTPLPTTTTATSTTTSTTSTTGSTTTSTTTTGVGPTTTTSTTSTSTTRTSTSTSTTSTTTGSSSTTTSTTTSTTSTTSTTFTTTTTFTASTTVTTTSIPSTWDISLLGSIIPTPAPCGYAGLVMGGVSPYTYSYVVTSDGTNGTCLDGTVLYSWSGTSPTLPFTIDGKAIAVTCNINDCGIRTSTFKVTFTVTDGAGKTASVSGIQTFKKIPGASWWCGSGPPCSSGPCFEQACASGSGTFSY